MFTLLEGPVARTVHVLRSSYVTEQAANRLGHKHGSRLETRVRMHTDKDIMPVCVCFLELTMSWFTGEQPGFVYLPLRFKIIDRENVDVSLPLTKQIKNHLLDKI